eukprot:403336141
MNLSQIEQRFQQLEIKENYVRYFYNPQCRKIFGLKQHAYIDELQKDYDQDSNHNGQRMSIKNTASIDLAQSNKGGSIEVSEMTTPQNKNQTSIYQQQQNDDFDEEYQSQLLDSAYKNTNKQQQQFRRSSQQNQHNYGVDHQNTAIPSDQKPTGTQGLTINQRRKLLSKIKISKFDMNRPKTSSHYAKKRQSFDGLFSTEGKHIISQCQPSQNMIKQYHVQQLMKEQQTEQIVSNLPTDRSNATQFNGSEEQLLDQGRPQKSPVIAEETQIFINGKQATQSQSVQQEPLKELTNVQIMNTENIDISNLVNRVQIKRGPPIHAQSSIDQQSQSENIVMQAQEIYDSLSFNIKLTDLSDLENPFVMYENKKIDEDGYIIFDNLDWNVLNPTKMFAWLQNAKDLEKRTLKIEVTYQQELVLLRFIHLDKFYPLKFPQIMLEISNNMLQNQNLLHKQEQQQQVLNQKHNKISQSSAEDLIDLESQRQNIEDGSEDTASQFRGFSQTSMTGGIANPYEHYYYHQNAYNMDLNGEGTTKIADLLVNQNRPYSQGRTLPNRQGKQNFNSILIGKGVNSSKLSIQSTNYTRTATLPNNPNFNRATTFNNNSEYFDQSANNKSLIHKYGQNRSVQFYMRKELDAQLQQNRKQLIGNKPQSAAAINMKDNRQIYRHMSYQNKVLSTQPMPLIFGNLTRPGLSEDMLKGEIILEQNLRQGDDMQSNGDIPEFFQSVKSNSNGGFGVMSNQGDDQREYMNFPYSRAQDVLGASLATPSTFFKANAIQGFNQSFGAVSSSIIGRRKESRGRPSTQGGNINQRLAQIASTTTYGKGKHLKNESSLAYFDQANQIFGIQGKNSFY